MSATDLPTSLPVRDGQGSATSCIATSLIAATDSWSHRSNCDEQDKPTRPFEIEKAEVRGLARIWNGLLRLCNRPRIRGRPFAEVRGGFGVLGLVSRLTANARSCYRRSRDSAAD